MQTVQGSFSGNEELPGGVTTLTLFSSPLYIDAKRTAIANAFSAVIQAQQSSSFGGGGNSSSRGEHYSVSSSQVTILALEFLARRRALLDEFDEKVVRVSDVAGGAAWSSLGDEETWSAPLRALAAQSVATHYAVATENANDAYAVLGAISAAPNMSTALLNNLNKIFNTTNFTSDPVFSGSPPQISDVSSSNETTVATFTTTTTWHPPLNHSKICFDMTIGSACRNVTGCFPPVTTTTTTTRSAFRVSFYIPPTTTTTSTTITSTTSTTRTQLALNYTTKPITTTVWPWWKYTTTTTSSSTTFAVTPRATLAPDDVVYGTSAPDEPTILIEGGYVMDEMLPPGISVFALIEDPGYREAKRLGIARALNLAKQMVSIEGIERVEEDTRARRRRGLKQVEDESSSHVVQEQARGTATRQLALVETKLQTKYRITITLTTLANLIVYQSGVATAAFALETTLAPNTTTSTAAPTTPQGVKTQIRSKVGMQMTLPADATSESLMANDAFTGALQKAFASAVATSTGVAVGKDAISIEGIVVSARRLKKKIEGRMLTTADKNLEVGPGTVLCERACVCRVLEAVCVSRVRGWCCVTYCRVRMVRDEERMW